jgi:hypothetical protein
MKPNELKQLIREIVKQEVSSEMNNQMIKLVAQILKETHNNTNETPRLEEGVSKKPNIKNRKITGNPILDSVLSETKPFSREEKSEFSQIINEGFDRIGGNETAITEPATKLDYLKQIVSRDTPQRSSIMDNPAPEVKKLFNKDFRAILNKSKNPSSGMFNPGSILSGEGEAPQS